MHDNVHRISEMDTMPYLVYCLEGELKFALRLVQEKKFNELNKRLPHIQRNLRDILDIQLDINQEYIAKVLSPISQWSKKGNR